MTLEEFVSQNKELCDFANSRQAVRVLLKILRELTRVTDLDDKRSTLIASDAIRNRQIAERILNSEAEMDKPLELSVRCTWTEDNDGVWSSECGLVWSFENGKVCENNIEYCMRCGRLVDAHEYDPETEQ